MLLTLAAKTCTFMRILQYVVRGSIWAFLLLEVINASDWVYGRICVHCDTRTLTWRIRIFSIWQVWGWFTHKVKNKWSTLRHAKEPWTFQDYRVDWRTIISWSVNAPSILRWSDIPEGYNAMCSRASRNIAGGTATTWNRVNRLVSPSIGKRNNWS